MASDNTISKHMGAVAPLFEGTAAEDLLPGMLIKLKGDNLYYRSDDEVGDKTNPIFAVIDIEGGKSIDDIIPSGDKVYARHYRGGDVIVGLLQPNTGMTIGAPVKSAGVAGPGYVTLATGGYRFMEAVGYSLETIEVSAEVQKLKIVCY